MILALFAIGIAVSILTGLLVAWPVMLLFGVVSDFLPIIPAFGYWQTLAIVLLIRLLFPSPTNIDTK